MDIMLEIGGAECLNDFNEELHGDVLDLISSASNGVKKLSPRAREARLNLLWRDFVAKHRESTARGSKKPVVL